MVRTRARSFAIRCGLVVWGIGTTLVLEAPVRAQDGAPAEVADEPSLEDADTRARRHFTTGQSLYAERSYESALREFEEAYRLSPRPRLLYNISLCHERLGSFATAAEHLARYLATASDVADRDVLERRLQNLRDRARPAHISVDASPDDASIVVDGAPVGVGRVTHELSPGRHHLRVVADDHQPFEEHFELAPGESLTIVADLEGAATIWTSPIFWTVVGAVVVGAGVAIGIGIATRPEEYGGTADRIFVVGN